ncbi:HAMP domain-containing histidine kinase [Martelella alba]|uniref:histidine kinase n=1 Tax=Martelella alba TaxID=2590451 RepID=A0A506U7G8_9HYPH|nr:HAMP domain-containing sensor histidine kinase [Martelella alba]TPW29428.1 HAMP domain-containing histidine kinase [Martelella alba]
MGRLRLLLRSTAVKLSIIYVVLFGLCAAVMVIYVTAVSERLVVHHMRDSLEEEITQMRDTYQRGGMRLLFSVIDRRAHQPGANIYVLASPQGEVLAGNVASIQPGTINETGWIDPPFSYERFSEPDRPSRANVATGYVFELQNGMRLLIGRDLGDPEELRLILKQALLLALLIMGVGALIIWLAIGRTALQRIDGMSSASRKIMAGDLSQRLPVSGSGDEFDRLSDSLNVMLERIVKLNEGLRQVSDNIAHDLKTPLTRLRNKAADAIAEEDEQLRRQALEGIISESDQLIRTFNALLMISRVEAGSSAAEMSEIDLSAIATDSGELYDPVAEEAGLQLVCEIENELQISGNRELIGQAIFNLLDNAIKYSSDCSKTGVLRLVLRHDEDMAALIVADDGAGIPSAQMDEVKKRFVRLDSSRSKPGTGLGLSLVEAVAEMHKGELSLAPASQFFPEMQGLAAIIKFPLKKA